MQAGSIEGQVVEVGLTTTSLLNPEKFPVIVPNSLFSSQVCHTISIHFLPICTLQKFFVKFAQPQILFLKKSPSWVNDNQTSIGCN